MFTLARATQLVSGLKVSQGSAAPVTPHQQGHPATAPWRPCPEISASCRRCGGGGNGGAGGGGADGPCPWTAGCVPGHTPPG